MYFQSVNQVHWLDDHFKERDPGHHKHMGPHGLDYHEQQTGWERDWCLLSIWCVAICFRSNWRVKGHGLVSFLPWRGKILPIFSCSSFAKMLYHSAACVKVSLYRGTLKVWYEIWSYGGAREQCCTYTQWNSMICTKISALLQWLAW